jgi:cobalt-zinc-cadmium efflux system outer membrane protein
MKPKVFVSSLIAVLAPVGGGANAHAACESVQSYRDLISCAEARSPDVQRAEAELQTSRAQSKIAGQLLNPDLSSTGVFGRSSEGSQSETDVSLVFPLEFGGKRSARIAAAENGARKAEAQLLETRAKVRMEVISKLHRLRQILSEQELVNESLDTFSKLVKQYEGRPKLSPEQEVTLSVFRMAKGDYILRSADLAEDLSKIQAFARLTLGVEISKAKTLLPKRMKDWPPIGADSGSTISPQTKVLEAELQLAKSELERARSESWPTVSVGPAIKLTSDAGKKNQLYGFGLGLPLPVLSQNNAARQAAAIGVEATELKMRLGLLEQKNEREEKVQTYQRSLASLSQIAAPDELQERHHKVETFFLRGQVPGALVIEAHRSLVDLEKARNERELKTIEAYLEIQMFDGKILETEL